MNLKRQIREVTAAQRGQAAVELLFALPVLLVVLAAVWQIALAGRAWWSVGESARLAARAAYVAPSSDRDAAAERAVARSLPRDLGRLSHVSLNADGAVRVDTRVPLVTPFAAVVGGDHAPRVSARSEFGR